MKHKQRFAEKKVKVYLRNDAKPRDRSKTRLPSGLLEEGFIGKKSVMVTKGVGVVSSTDGLGPG